MEEGTKSSGFAQGVFEWSKISAPLKKGKSDEKDIMSIVNFMQQLNENSSVSNLYHFPRAFSDLYGNEVNYDKAMIKPRRD